MLFLSYFRVYQLLTNWQSVLPNKIFSEKYAIEQINYLHVISAD